MGQPEHPRGFRLAFSRGEASEQFGIPCRLIHVLSNQPNNNATVPSDLFVRCPHARSFSATAEGLGLCPAQAA
jgi:hypothetical protein